MNMLTTFVLMGVIDSHDGTFATVELNTNPASMADQFSRLCPCQLSV